MPVRPPSSAPCRSSTRPPASPPPRGSTRTRLVSGLVLAAFAIHAAHAGHAARGDGAQPSIEIVAPLGELLTGLLRFDARVHGEGVERVTFWLDDREHSTRRSPPWSVELDLGPVPRRRVLRITAHDAGGAVIANDELVLNAGPYRFAARLVEPFPGSRHDADLRARVEVAVPPDATLERVELYLGDERRAVLREEPFVERLPLPAPGAQALVRAVAVLTDGRRAEDAAIVNGAAVTEEVDVDLVELYVTVLDRDRRPVRGLEAADFVVREDGVEQRLARFEVVRDRPVHAVILIDASASMAPRIERVVVAARGFFARTVRPAGEDRVAAILFDDRPRLAVPFTADRDRFAAGLGDVRAARGTALYDSLIYALYLTEGLPGQRAVLLLSDGADELSRHDFDDALEYARRSRAAIYAIGIDLGGDGSPRRVLGRLAAETGGRAFFLPGVAELDAIYATILAELRARYLLVYQSHAIPPDRPRGARRDAFRRVEVEVRRRGLEAQTLRGYYP